MSKRSKKIREICAYGIIAPHETERHEALLKNIGKFENNQISEAIFPKFRKIPCAKEIQKASIKRCNRQLSLAEMGCLLSHRKVWKTFARSDYSLALVLESDSEIQNIDLVNKVLEEYGDSFDLFFFGAYNGRIKLRHSTTLSLGNGYKIGVPLETTIFCAYGYMINKVASLYLLKATRRAAWPVDYWKEWLVHNKHLYQIRVGAVTPEVISTWETPSSIQSAKVNILSDFKAFLVDIFNSLRAFFR